MISLIISSAFMERRLRQSSFLARSTARNASAMGTTLCWLLKEPAELLFITRRVVESNCLFITVEPYVFTFNTALSEHSVILCSPCDEAAAEERRA